MKRALSFILVITLLLSVFIPASVMVSAADTVIINFDENVGFSTAFSSTVSFEANNKKEGVHSMRVDFKDQTKHTDKIGGMVYYEFATPIDMSSYKTVTLDYWIPNAFSGSRGIQINFCSTGKDDGFNFMTAQNDRSAGWNQAAVTLSNPTAVANNPNWSSIRAVRITYFNFAVQEAPAFMLLDNMVASTGSGSTSSTTPPASSTPSSGTVTTGLIHGFDSTANFTPAFSTALSIDGSNKQEGSGAMVMSFEKPAANDNGLKIGGMAIYNAPTPLDLSKGDNVISFYYYVPNTVSQGGLQINFGSNGSQDGFNYMNVLDGKTAGWHIASISRANPTQTVSDKNPNWASINTIRITYFNYALSASPAKIIIDNLRFGVLDEPSQPDPSAPVVDPNFGHAAYADDGDLMVHDADSLNGWKGFCASTVALDTTLKTQGTGAVTIKSTVPTGQPSNIGAMGKLAVPTGNFSGYIGIVFDLYISDDLTGSQGFQVNFISEGSDDGFNFMKAIDNCKKGWYRVEFKVSQPTNVASERNPSWGNINYIRFTWFNNSQLNIKATFTVDNLRFHLGHSTYKEGDSTMLHNFDKRVGLLGEVGTTVEAVKSTDTDLVKQGAGSLKVIPNGKTDRADKISARFVVAFDSKAVLSDGKRFSLKMRIPSPLTGSNTLHIAFVTDTSGYSGFNFNYDLTDAEAGWHTIEMGVDEFTDKDSSPRLRWANINRIVVTWLNNDGLAYSEPFYFDDFRMINVEESTSSVVEPSSTVEPSDVPSVDTPSNDTPSVDEPAFTYGDVDENGEITSADALLALQYSVQKVEFTDRQKLIADVAKPISVNSSDALAILQFAVQKISEFDPPVQPTPSVPESSVVNPPVSSTPVSSTTSSEVFEIPDSVVNNNAYGKDTTADNSFKITHEGLLPKTIYLVTSNVPGTSYDHARFVYSLQGLINRDFGIEGGHTSLVYMNGVDASDTTWYNYMTAEGATFNGFGRKIIRTWDDLYNAFEPQIKQCGLAVWDPQVPATANVAATICGVDGHLPVVSGSVVETYLKGKGVEEKISLVRRFTGANTGSAKNDAYRWALDNYFSRCSSKYIAYTIDGACTVQGNVHFDDVARHCLQNHDYLIARRCFFFDLDPYNGEVACDAGGGKVGLDNETMLMILQQRYSRANGEIGQILGFIPWWNKYASDGVVAGNKGTKVSTWLEWLLCEYIACYNLAKEADAVMPCSMSNASVYYKYTVKDAFKNNKTQQGNSYNANTYYYTIYVGDYDSSAWVKKYVAQFWMSDSTRGKLPLMWSMNPNLAHRVPQCFEYMYDNLTANDYMAAGEGAGYLIPSGLSSAQKLSYAGINRPAANANAMSKWATYNKGFYQMCDMNITGFIINGSNSLTAEIADCYNQFNTVGAFHGDSYKQFYSHNGVPYVHVTSAGDAANIYSKTTGYASKFGCFRTVSWSPTEIKTLVDNTQAYFSARGRTAQYLDPYTFFAYAKQSGRLTAF